MRPGGENVEQFAEYHRGKRLAEAVIDAAEAVRPHRTSVPANPDQTTAETFFLAWLRDHRPDRTRQADLEELVIELADSWHIDSLAGLYHTRHQRRRRQAGLPRPHHRVASCSCRSVAQHATSARRPLRPPTAG